MTIATGWRKKQIMTKQREQMENRDPLEVVKIVVEALDDAYAEGVRNASRPWQGLTPDEVKKASLKAGMQEHYMDFHSGFIRFADEISTILKEKNTNA